MGHPARRTGDGFAKRRIRQGGFAKERIRQKATTLVEDSLITVYQMIHDDTSTATAKLDSFRTLAKMAGVGGDARTEGSGARFSVSIDLGGEKSVTIEGSSVDLEDED